MKRSKLAITLVVLAAGAAALVVGLAVAQPEFLRLLFMGESRKVRDENQAEHAAAPHERVLLVLALDGVGRDLLYDMLRAGALPQLAGLLGGGSGAQFPHAHFVSSALSTMPSSTRAAWASVFTGATPAEHGVAGNEYFVRETAPLAPETFCSWPIMATSLGPRGSLLLREPGPLLAWKPLAAGLRDPLIVAHPNRTSADLRQWTLSLLGEHPGQADIAKLLLAAVGRP